MVGELRENLSSPDYPTVAAVKLGCITSPRKNTDRADRLLLVNV